MEIMRDGAGVALNGYAGMVCSVLVAAEDYVIFLDTNTHLNANAVVRDDILYVSEMVLLRQVWRTSY